MGQGAIRNVDAVGPLLLWCPTGLAQPPHGHCERVFERTARLRQRAQVLHLNYGHGLKTHFSYHAFLLLLAYLHERADRVDVVWNLCGKSRRLLRARSEERTPEGLPLDDKQTAFELIPRFVVVVDRESRGVICRFEHPLQDVSVSCDLGTKAASRIRYAVAL